VSRVTGKSSAVSRRRVRRPAVHKERHHSRFGATLPVRCTQLTARCPRAWRGRTANVSGGGLAADLPTRLPPRTRVAIEIRTGIGPLRMEADVLWTRRVAGKDGITRHGLCLADRSEVMDLPIHVLLGQWLQRLARRETKEMTRKAGRGGVRPRRVSRG
jgi:hypothetical protein